MAPIRLRYNDIAGHRPCHAALVPVRGTGHAAGLLHSHDFHEIALVRAGSADHHVGTATVRLGAGELTVIRPADAHRFVAVDDDGFDLVNIAFPSSTWRQFCRLADVDAGSWDSGAAPLVLSVAARARDAFDVLLGRSFGPLTRVDLFAFLAEIVRVLPTTHDGADVPAWLALAHAALDDEQGLAHGITAMAGAAAVTKGHLARTMSRYEGRSPAGYVNDRRLQHAALLLATTNLSVSRIAARSGFASHSYFDRRFAEKFDCAPVAYRADQRRVMAPPRTVPSR